MNILKDIFDTAVDVAVSPVRLGAAVFDEVVDDDEASEVVNRVTEKIKGPRSS